MPRWGKRRAKHHRRGLDLDSSCRTTLPPKKVHTFSSWIEDAAPSVGRKAPTRAHEYVKRVTREQEFEDLDACTPNRATDRSFKPAAGCKLEGRTHQLETRHHHHAAHTDRPSSRKPKAAPSRRERRQNAAAAQSADLGFSPGHWGSGNRDRSQRRLQGGKRRPGRHQRRDRHRRSGISPSLSLLHGQPDPSPGEIGQVVGPRDRIPVAGSRHGDHRD